MSNIEEILKRKAESFERNNANKLKKRHFQTLALPQIPVEPSITKSTQFLVGGGEVSVIQREMTRQFQAINEKIETIESKRYLTKSPILSTHGPKGLVVISAELNQKEFL